MTAGQMTAGQMTAGQMTAGQIAAERMRATPEADGPVAQSVRIGFRVLYVGMALLGLAWATGNLRQVAPGSQAVILRLGQVVGVQQAGLVVAWPRPLDQVVLLPDGERQMELRIDAGSARSPGVEDAASLMLGERPPSEAGVFLTGDGGVVLLLASLTWRIADPAAYYVAADHVAPALRRLYLAAAADLAARHDLDDVMVVRPEHAADPRAQAQRAAMRGDLVRGVNDRLAALARAGSSLGVEVVRADVVALLPPSAKQAFDQVLDATQMADRGLAAARTDAARTLQAADRDRDRLLADAHAAAAEFLAAARHDTAGILALEQHMDAAARPSLLDQVWRDRIAGILHQAGVVSAIDARAVSHLIVPGGGQR